MVRVRWWSLLLASLLGCGGASSQGTTAPEVTSATSGTFPRPDELARLATGEAGRLEAQGMEVATWSLAGPFADAIEPVLSQAPAPWDGLLAASGGASVVVTQDMGCAAREIGRFYLAHGKAPTETLRRFVSGWCGATVTDADVRFLSGEVPPEMAEAEVFQQWHDQALALVTKSTGRDRMVGVWFGREGNRAVLAVANSRPRARLEPLASAPEADGQVVLRGTVLTKAERVTVLVNRGRLGVAECALDDGVALPAFVARCLLDPADASAWIEVSAFAPGRILGTPVLRVLTRRRHATPTYALGADAAAEAAGAHGASAAELLGLINGARREASLEPLVLAETEARRAATLAPLASQAALLRVIEAREVIPVGSTQPVHVDVRIVAATHRDLRQMVKRGAFRADLLARLSGHVVLLPPLRKRIEDLGILVDAAFRLHAPARSSSLGLHREAARYLLARKYPLNTRELVNAIGRAIALTKGDLIGPEHLEKEVATAIGALLAFVEAKEMDRVVEVAEYCRDTVDMYVQEEEAMDSSDPRLEERICAHPLMQRELQRQAEDLRLLATLELDAEGVHQLRSSWYAPEKGSLD